MASEIFVIDEKGKKREPNLMESFLIKHGWSQYYHAGYWVNRKVIDDHERKDHTNYGRSFAEAVAWESGYQKALKDNHLI